MNTDGTPAGPAPARPGVAAFDFDGTLTRRDTLLPFLRRTCGGHRVARAVAAAARRTRDRDVLKVAAIDQLFRGWPAERLEQLGAAYAAELHRGLRPEVLDRLRWHQASDHAVLLVSASLGAYLRPLAQDLGIDAVLAVELAVNGDGVLTGGVVGGANTRGPEKAARLLSWTAGRFGPDTDVELWAYGDSPGDAELLTLADHPSWVGRRRVPGLVPVSRRPAGTPPVTSAASARRRRDG
ncbi:MAG TPA: HAD family hydrolase [Acidimicrobiales bacterium]